jgi:2-succinyl-6-hydroxy-2,4-cyclohexadiene-1-carboxylate synthase
VKIYSDHIDYYCTIHQNDTNLPYLLMLHGFMGSGEVFGAVIEKLMRFCNPVTIDLPGHGKSDGSEDPERYQTEKQLNDLDSILQRLKLNSLILYGYSMGGRLALNMALEYPGYFSGMILESSTCGIISDQERKKRAGIDEKRAKEIENDYTGFLKEWMSLPLFKCENIKKEHRSVYSSVMENQKPIFMAACLRGFGSGSMQPVCGRLTTFDKPVLLLAGSKDEKFVKINRQMEHELPDAATVIVRDACHRVHLDQPGKLVMEIETYIKQKIL